MDKHYACIKDGLVFNTLVIDNERTDIIQQIIDTVEVDELIELEDGEIVEVGFEYNGSEFINPNEILDENTPSDKITAEIPEPDPSKTPNAPEE
jgi:hypothetical protein